MEDQGEIAIACGNIPPILLPKCYRGQIMFLDINFSKPLELYCLELGFHPSIADIVVAMNLLFQERDNHSVSGIIVKVSRRTQRNEIYHANEGSGFAFYCMDLGHVFGSNAGNEIGVMLNGKGPHKSKSTYDFVRIHSLMIYMDLVEKIILGDTKVPLLRCFFIFPKLKTGKF